MKALSPVKRILLFIFLLAASNLYGQGTLTGVITDSVSNEKLFGASIILTGTALGDASNIEGEYKVNNIPEAQYDVKISYIGYKTKIMQVNITNNKTLKLNVSLVPDVVVGTTVEVTAQAFGQAAAINQQRTSNTIINVVSEEKIKELPDANAAEAIGRLPGVSILRSGGEANKIILRGLSDQYVNITIDGVKVPPTDADNRGVDLSTISQSSLAGIELFKALTPDKDADALAGTVNLVTKKAPSQRTFWFESRGGYNQVMKSLKQYNFSAHYGERYFDDLLGVQFTGNLENIIRSSERTNLGYDQTIKNQTDYAINNLTVRFTDEIRKRNGASILLDLNTPDNGNIKLTNVYSGTNRNYLISTRNYPTNSDSGVTYIYNDIEQQINTFNSSLIGNNNLFNMDFYWGLSFAQSNSKLPYNYFMQFLEPSVLNVSGMKNSPSNLKDSPEKLIPYAWNNFKAASLYQAFYTSQANLDKDKTAFLNISRDYIFGDFISGEIKLGGKYNLKNRTNINGQLYSPYYLGYWQPYEKLADGSIQSKNFNGTAFEGFYQNYLQNPANNIVSFSYFLNSNPESRDIFNLYKLYPFINRDYLHQWYDLNKNGVDKNGKAPEYTDDPSAKVDNYEVTERVGAAYIMNTLNLGQELTFIAGLRVEDENNDYKAAYSPTTAGGFPIPVASVRDTTASHKETILLPNFHLNFKPYEFMNIRIAAYKALARPDFNYRLLRMFSWRPAATSSNRQLYMGNPLLKTAQAWNFEINTSFFGNEIGLISFSAYYRQIDNIFHYLNGINTQGRELLNPLGLGKLVPDKIIPGGTYNLYVPYNAPGVTKVWGFEFEHQINFIFLPGLLKNVVLSYNASLVKSQTRLLATVTDTIKYFLPDFPGIPFYRYQDSLIVIKRQLENQPEFYGNISLGYDIGGFSGRLSLFYQSEYNLSFTPTGRGDQVVNSFTRLDLALKYRFTDYLSALLSISNLTNIKESNSIYNRVNGYKILNNSERYGVTADFGLKLEL